MNCWRLAWFLSLVLVLGCGSEPPQVVGTWAIDERSLVFSSLDRPVDAKVLASRKDQALRHWSGLRLHFEDSGIVTVSRPGRLRERHPYRNDRGVITIGPEDALVFRLALAPDGSRLHFSQTAGDGTALFFHLDPSASKTGSHPTERSVR